MRAEELREALGDGDAERRRQGIIALGEDPTALEDAARLVIDALGDSDWRVRKEAVRVAADLAETLELVPGLVETLCDGENVGRRNAALEVLGRVGPAAAEPLLEALPEVPSGARKFVVDALGDVGDPRVVPPLVEATKDADANLAAAALDALARVGGPEAEKGLRDCLSSSDPFQRLAALDGLARLGAVVPWEEVEPLLGDRIARRVALVVLGRTGRAEAVGPLVDALADRLPQLTGDAAYSLVRLLDHSDEVARAVRERLAGLTEESGLTSLRKLVREGGPDSRRAAARLLLCARDPETLGEIAALAADDELSPEALEALRSWGAAAVRPLLDVYRATGGATDATALELGADLAVQPPDAAGEPPLRDEVRGALREALVSDDERLVLAAARSMTLWADPCDAPLLVSLAARGSEEVGRACGAALEALGRSSSDAVREALEGMELAGPEGAALATVLVRVGGTRVIERLQTALSADDPATRRAVIEALASVGGVRAAELIGYALADEDVDVQSVAARALGRLRDEEGRPLGDDALLLSLQSESTPLQTAAARALGEAGEQGAIEPLRELVRSPHAGVAVAAMEALRALHDPTLGDQLVEALGHRDPEVVKQALRGIPESGGPRAAARLALGLEHSSWDVRALAAHLLGKLEGDEPVRALEAALESEQDDLVRQALEEALASRPGGRG